MIEKSWNYETDVLIVGGGGSGLSAAVEAAEHKADVIVLEKMPFVGGDTALSAGTLFAVGTHIQKKHKIYDSPEIAYKDMVKVGGGASNLELLKLLAEKSGETFDWLTQLGVKFEDKVYPRDECTVPRCHAVLPNSSAYIKVLKEAAEKRSVEIILNTKAVRLIRSRGGEVIGVKAEDLKRKKILKIKAKKAVILATGSFAANKRMRRKYCPIETVNIATACNPGNTGDGHKMASAIGVDMVNMNIGGQPCGPMVDHTFISRSFIVNGAILVNKKGKRFVNELSAYPLQNAAILAQPGRVCYVIFDRQVAIKGVNFYQTYKDLGYLIEADTLEKLAKKLRISIKELKKTIYTWNIYVKMKKDLEFGRTNFGCGIKASPFYSLKATVKVILTEGGLKINSKCQTINTLGRIVPRLYAVGQVGNGGIFGVNTISGMHLAWAFTSGRIAGKNAALELPCE
ncbi:MAG: flavocytochrome c [Candidatus Bathyarchaeia archaeon]